MLVGYASFWRLQDYASYVLTHVDHHHVLALVACIQNEQKMSDMTVPLRMFKRMCTFVSSLWDLSLDNLRYSLWQVESIDLHDIQSKSTKCVLFEIEIDRRNTHEISPSATHLWCLAFCLGQEMNNTSDSWFTKMIRCDLHLDKCLMMRYICMTRIVLINTNVTEIRSCNKVCRIDLITSVASSSGSSHIFIASSTPWSIYISWYADLIGSYDGYYFCYTKWKKQRELLW